MLNFSQGVFRHQHVFVLPNFTRKIFRYFFLYCALWTLNLSMKGVQVPTFLGHAKFEVKDFSEFFCLQSALDSEFFRGGVWAATFFGHAKFEVTIF